MVSGYFSFIILGRDAFKWTFIGSSEALAVKHLSAVEASYHTGGSVGRFLSKKMIPPPVVTLCCFIVEEILSA